MKDNDGNKFYPCPYYPIGSIYLSVNNINPANYFGGDWEQIENVFLLGCSTKYPVGSTGGTEKHQHLLPIAIDNGIDNWNIMQWNNSFGYGTISYNSANINHLNNWPEAKSQTLQQLKDKEESNMPPYLAVYMWKRVA